MLNLLVFYRGLSWKSASAKSFTEGYHERRWRGGGGGGSPQSELKRYSPRGLHRIV